MRQPPTLDRCRSSNPTPRLHAFARSSGRQRALPQPRRPAAASQRLPARLRIEKKPPPRTPLPPAGRRESADHRVEGTGVGVAVPSG